MIGLAVMLNCTSFISLNEFMQFINIFLYYCYIKMGHLFLDEKLCTYST